MKISLFYTLCQILGMWSVGSSLNITVSECNCRELVIACNSTATIAILEAVHLFKAFNNTICQYPFGNCKNKTNCCTFEADLDCKIPFDSSELKSLMKTCSNRTCCRFKQTVKKKDNCNGSTTSYLNSSTASVVQYECIQSDQDVDAEQKSTWYIAGAIAGVIICCVFAAVIIGKRKKQILIKHSQHRTRTPVIDDQEYSYAVTPVIRQLPQQQNDEEYDVLSHNGSSLIPKATESNYDHIGGDSGEESYDHLKQYDGDRKDTDISEYFTAITIP